MFVSLEERGKHRSRCNFFITDYVINHGDVTPNFDKKKTLRSICIKCYDRRRFTICLTLVLELHHKNPNDIFVTTTRQTNKNI